MLYIPPKQIRTTVSKHLAELQSKHPHRALKHVTARGRRDPSGDSRAIGPQALDTSDGQRGGISSRRHFRGDPKDMGESQSSGLKTVEAPSRPPGKNGKDLGVGGAEKGRLFRSRNASRAWALKAAGMGVGYQFSE